MSDEIGDEGATYRLYADIFPRIADSFSEQARAGLTAAMGPVQERMNQIAQRMGDTAGLEFGTKFRSRVDDAIRLASGTVTIALDLDTSSVYAKLDAIRASTADNISQTLHINTSGLDEAQAQLSTLSATATITPSLDQGAYDQVKSKLDELGQNLKVKVSADPGTTQADVDAIQAKSDAALALAKAKADATSAQIQAKDDAARGQIEAKNTASLVQIQAKNDAALAAIKARNDAALAQIQARQDASGSSSSSNNSGGGLSAPSLFASSVGLGITAASGPAVGAALGAIPVLFGAIGAAAEHSNGQVVAAFDSMKTAAGQALKQGFEPLVPTFVQIENQAKATLVGMQSEFDQASRAAAPLVSTLSGGALNSAVVLVAGFTSQLSGLQPIATATATGMEGLSNAVVGLLSHLNVGGAAQGLTLLFNGVSALLPVAADLINELMPVGNALLGLVPTIASLIHGGLDVLGPILAAIAAVLTLVGKGLNAVATPVGAAAVAFLALWAAVKIGQGIMIAGEFLLGGYQVAMKAASVAVGLFAGAEDAAATSAGFLDVALSPLLIPLGLVVAGLAGIAYGFKELINPEPVVTSIDHITGAITWLGVKVGQIPADALAKLNNVPSIISQVAGAINNIPGLSAAEAASPVPGQGNVDVANLVQTDLSNRLTLIKNVTTATQAYSDAQYQQAASSRSVAAAGRGVAAAVRGVQDAQASLATAQQSVRDAQSRLTNDEITAKNTVLELTEARKAAAQQLKDYTLQLTDQAAAQTSASIALFDAQQAAQAAGIDTLHGPVGLPTAPLTAANEAQQKTQLALVQAQNQYNDSINTGGKLQDTANAAFAKGIDNSDQVVAAQKAIASAYSTVEQDSRALGNAQNAVVKAQQAVVDARHAVVDAVQSQTDAYRSQAAAVRATQQALGDLKSAQNAATISTDINTQAGRDNYAQAQALITADVKLGLGSKDLTARFADQESQLGLTKQQIFDTAQQTGQFTDNQLAAMAQHLDLTGTKVGNLNIDLSGTKVRLGDLDGIKVNFDVNGVGSIDLTSLYQSLGYTAADIRQIQQQQVSGAPQGSANALLHSAGGAITGYSPTPTSDNIPAMLTAGEHVWSVDEVNKAGGHQAVERMRRSVRGFASGGAVTAADALSAAGVIALGQAMGTAYDTGAAIGGALRPGTTSFLPDNHKTSLKYLNAPARTGVPGAVLVGVIPQGQHKAIIDAALTADGVPAGQWPQWEIGLNTLVGRESGWNPNSINLWDSNAKAGHPSQGLGQTILGTFEAYRAKSLVDNILDPVANLSAVVNYINTRYHGIGNVQQANASLPPKGYDNGGWLTGLGVNTSGRPEAVLTADESAGLKAAVKQGPIRLDDYSIGKLAQAMVLASHERPIEVNIGSQPGLGLIV